MEAESTRAPRWVEEAGGFLAVAEVEGFPAGREFAEAFVNQSRPVVIKVGGVVVHGVLHVCAFFADAVYTRGSHLYCNY